MHFLDAWTELSAGDLVRLLAPVGLMLLATLMPGRRVARVAALGLAALVPLLRELAIGAPLVLGWVALWLLIAWRSGLPADQPRRRSSGWAGLIESGAIGFLLGLALLGLLLAAVARQAMAPEDARRASLGVLLLGIGLLYLMLHRHARRATLGFAALALGLQVLDGAARGAQVAPSGASATAVLLAAWMGTALMLRVAAARERHAGSAWVSDAHDLHD
jgi:hypothetical protein